MRTACICSDRFARRPIYLPSSESAIEYTGLADIIVAPWRVNRYEAENCEIYSAATIRLPTHKTLLENY